MDNDEYVSHECNLFLRNIPIDDTNAFKLTCKASITSVNKTVYLMPLWLFISVPTGYLGNHGDILARIKRHIYYGTTKKFGGLKHQEEICFLSIRCVFFIQCGLQRVNVKISFALF